MGKIKRIITLLLVAIIIITAIPFSSQAKEEIEGQETLTNCDFENGVIGKSASGWSLVSVDISGTKYETDNDYTSYYTLNIAEDGYKGSKSLSISDKNKKGTRGYVLAESNYICVEGGADYTIEYAIKLQNVESYDMLQGGKVFVYQFNKNGKLLDKGVRVGNSIREDMDWNSFCSYVQVKKDAAFVKIAFYLGGTWEKNPGVKMLIDEVSFKKVDDTKLFNGSFEMGSGDQDIFSWHMTSKNIRNEVTTDSWIQNYSMVRDINGYHGDCVAITRKSYGYISLDSNIIKAVPSTTYVLDFAMTVENSIYDKFPGVRAYIAEYDINKRLITTTGVHPAIRNDIPWTEMTGTITTGEQTAYIQVEFWCAGGMDLQFTVRFDDVRLTKVERNMSKDGINNGNFEEVLDGTIMDWYMGKSEGVNFRSTFDGYNDTKGLKCVRTSDKYGLVSLKSNEFNIVSGKDYKLTYMARLENQSEDTYIIARALCYDKDGKLIKELRNNLFDYRTQNDEWLQVINYFTPPEKSVKCVIELLLCGTSFECWIDDVVWSFCDDSQGVYGFDALDKNNNLVGWTTTQPNATKVDTKTFRQGTSSLFVSQTTKNNSCRIMSDVMIPVESQTRYKFSIFVKNYGCDVSSDGMALHAYKYDKDGKYLGKITGNLTTMNREDEPSNWRELICGVSTKFDVAYVRLYLEVGSGTMNFWVDDLQWKVYSSDEEFTESFDIINGEGTPDGWDAVALSGEPKFVTREGVVSIQSTGNEHVGMIATKWDTSQQYTTCTFSTTYRTTINTDAKLTIKFYDYADCEIENQRIEKDLKSTGGIWVEDSFRFVSPAMVYAKIELCNKGSGTVDFDSLSIMRCEDEEEEVAVGEWRGQWIWHQEDHYDCRNSTRYFRTHVFIPDTPKIGRLQITGDDRVKLWINETEISLGSEGENWGDMSIVEDLQEYMVSGDNVIAIQVSNDTSAAGLLFDGYVETEKEEWIDICSNQSVVSIQESREGWNKINFDDSKWTACQVLGKVGVAPWGEYEFDASPYIDEKCEIVDYKITKNLEAGEEAKLTMTIIPQEDGTTEKALKANLWIRNTNTKVLEVNLKHIDGPAIHEWKEGKKITVSYSFQIPDFIGSGKYILQLNTNQIIISNMEIMNNKLTQAIHVTNEISESGATVQSEVKTINGTTTFSINGEPQPVVMYKTHIAGGTYSGIGPSEEYMHEAGVCVSLMATSNVYVPWWTGDEEYDFTYIDNYIYAALTDHQDTYLIINCGMDVPNWWKENNPDEITLTSDGRTPGVSPASDKFKKDAIAANLAMLEYVMQQPYANRVVGVFIPGLNSGEWVWYGGSMNSLDYSKASLNKWRLWLEDRYGTDQELQKVWNRKDVTLKTAEVPTFEEHEGNTYETILDPITQQNCIDYNIFMGDIVADVLNEAAAAVSELIDDRLMLGTYYGYVQSAYNYVSLTSAQTGVEKVLEAGYIDYFVAPTIYGERDDGEAAGYMQMTDSILLHGKAVLVEDDIRTCSWVDLNNNFYQRDEVGPVYNMSDTLSQMERAFSTQLTNGVGEQWTNLGGTYWEREQFSELIEIMNNERVVNLARQADYDNDVCYIIDEDMYPQMTHEFDGTYQYFRLILEEQRYELSKIGVSVDTYYMSDLTKGLVPEHKIYIMLSPIEVDSKEKAAIEKYLKKDNHVVVWQCLSGVSDGKKVSATTMSDLIGINVVLDNTSRSLSATFTNKKHWLIEGIQGEYYGNYTGKRCVSPTGIVNDSKATVLGYMYDDPKQAALAIKEMGDWTSIYSAVPCLPTELIRNLLEHYDIHIYSENRNDVIFANNNYVAVNTAYGGEREIKLDGIYAVYDVFGKTTYSLATDTIKITMEDNSTKLFRLTPTDKHVVYVDLDAHGSSKQEGYNVVKSGKDYECKITAEEGYAISAIKIDGVTTEVRDKSYKLTFEDLDNSHFVKVEFVRMNEEVEEVIEEDTFPIFILCALAGAAVITVGAIVILLILDKKGSKNNEKME